MINIERLQAALESGDPIELPKGLSTEEKRHFILTFNRERMDEALAAEVTDAPPGMTKEEIHEFILNTARKNKQ